MKRETPSQPHKHQPEPVDGWLPGARRIETENQDVRPPETRVDLLVIHNISLPAGQFGGPWIERLFTNQLRAEDHPAFAAIADLRVSAHLLIRRDGELIQFVDLFKRAWHAGVSCFEGREHCNDFSIGIELEGSDDTPFTDAQYQRLIDVTLDIRARFPDISPERITGHSDIAPERKTDPGPHFQWSRFLDAVKDAHRHGLLN